MKHTRRNQIVVARWALRGPTALICLLLAVLCLLPAAAAASQPVGNVFAVPASACSAMFQGCAPIHNPARNAERELRDYASALSDDMPEDIRACVSIPAVAAEIRTVVSLCPDSVCRTFFLPKRIIGSSV